MVLDPFTGSGTTGKVAMELGRRFVGVDLAYHELSRDRIESGIPGSAAWCREKNGVRRAPNAELPLFDGSGLHLDPSIESDTNAVDESAS